MRAIGLISLVVFGTVYYDAGAILFGKGSDAASESTKKLVSDSGTAADNAEYLAKHLTLVQKQTADGEMQQMGFVIAAADFLFSLSRVLSYIAYLLKVISSAYVEIITYNKKLETANEKNADNLTTKRDSAMETFRNATARLTSMEVTVGLAWTAAAATLLLIVIKNGVACTDSGKKTLQNKKMNQLCNGVSLLVMREAFKSMNTGEEPTNTKLLHAIDNYIALFSQVLELIKACILRGKASPKKIDFLLAEFGKRLGGEAAQTNTADDAQGHRSDTDYEEESDESLGNDEDEPEGRIPAKKGTGKTARTRRASGQDSPPAKKPPRQRGRSS
ncbi:MAG: hypothetical protein LBS14_02245 [Holosporaceae bacterium]|jgi:hypothetical protein|nr:hypothetical protein [Holosporaceae bacterium]